MATLSRFSDASKLADRFAVFPADVGALAVGQPDRIVFLNGDGTLTTLEGSGFPYRVAFGPQGDVLVPETGTVTGLRRSDASDTVPLERIDGASFGADGRLRYSVVDRAAGVTAITVTDDGGTDGCGVDTSLARSAEIGLVPSGSGAAGSGGVVLSPEIETRTETVKEVTRETATRTVVDVLRLPEGCGALRLLLRADGTTSVALVLPDGTIASAGAPAALGRLDPGMLPDGAIPPEVTADPATPALGTTELGTETRRIVTGRGTGRLPGGADDFEVGLSEDILVSGDLSDIGEVVVLAGTATCTVFETERTTGFVTELSVTDGPWSRRRRSTRRRRCREARGSTASPRRWRRRRRSRTCRRSPTTTPRRYPPAHRC